MATYTHTVRWMHRRCIFSLTPWAICCSTMCGYKIIKVVMCVCWKQQRDPWRKKAIHYDLITSHPLFNIIQSSTKWKHFLWFWLNSDERYQRGDSGTWRSTGHRQQAAKAWHGWQTAMGSYAGPTTGRCGQWGARAIDHGRCMEAGGVCGVIPRFEKVETKPPYVCPGCSNHTYSNNMINMCHVR
jgi:hypothetical protein